MELGYFRSTFKRNKKMIQEEVGERAQWEDRSVVTWDKGYNQDKKRVIQGILDY